jgi:hypothetical protein
MPPRKDPATGFIPAEAFDDDERESYELSSTENADLCAGCIRCCSYITIEIDSPRSAEEYDQWIWALYHDHISIFVEKPEKWFVQVDTRCGKLDAGGRCSIYGSHPVLCRKYDARSCERRLPVLDIVHEFQTGEQLEAWLRERRPAHFRRLQKFRAKHPVKVASAAPGLVNIQAPAAKSRSETNGGRGARPSGGASRSTAKTNGANGRRPGRARSRATSGVA